MISPWRTLRSRRVHLQGDMSVRLPPIVSSFCSRNLGNSIEDFMKGGPLTERPKCVGVEGHWGMHSTLNHLWYHILFYLTFKSMSVRGPCKT